MFRIFIFAALLAGVGAGLLLTGVQQWQVTPLILAAEKFEAPAEAQHSHEAPAHSHEQAHEHDAGAWSPAEGAERIVFTLFSNVLAGIGFALVMLAGMNLRGHSGWQKGLLWGLAGYLVFFIAPSLGLHPKVPGTAGAPLAEQQLWWISTVAVSAAGLALLAFGRSLLLRAMAIVLLAMPHIFGAPLPEVASSLVPLQLSNDFILATTIANAIFWIVLGSLAGQFLQFFMRPPLSTADSFANS
ncbi:Predicted cobalt transporter CbtA [hydrothermal vent metagenome]|uniref:Predicted cobalt transporter CbtA n=1 Tax=hydrothermal vent metagenome TaxID=652676 RepID=A0A3B1BYT5_9ZZZZ